MQYKYCNCEYLVWQLSRVERNESTLGPEAAMDRTSEPLKPTLNPANSGGNAPFSFGSAISARGPISFSFPPFCLFIPHFLQHLPAYHLAGVAALRSLVTLSTNEATNGSRTTLTTGIATHLFLWNGGLSFFPLGMAFGGLGIMLYSGRPSVLTARSIIQKVDLQSAFFAFVFVIVLLVLGAFTSSLPPSTNSHSTSVPFLTRMCPFILPIWHFPCWFL
jgi:hypothetical protein